MPVVGIDVSKAKLDCALLFDTERFKLRSKVTANNEQGFEELLSWACRTGRCEATQLHFVLEPTGVYHEQAALWLHGAGACVSLVNPAQLRDFAKGLAVRSKTDALDRAVLARYGHLLKPPPWQPPPEEVLILQSLMRRLDAIEADKRREENRLEKAVIAQAPESVQLSLGRSLAFLEEQRRELERLIDDHIDRHRGLKRDKALLESVPGVGALTAKRMLVVLRGRVFTRARQVAAYLGLVPVSYDSGTSVHRRPRLSKAGKTHVRAALYWPAVSAARWNPHVRALYERLLAKGKCKLSAIGAAMRKLVHICFGVLKHQCPYCPQAGTAC